MLREIEKDLWHLVERLEALKIMARSGRIGNLARQLEAFNQIPEELHQDTIGSMTVLDAMRGFRISATQRNCL